MQLYIRMQKPLDLLYCSSILLLWYRSLQEHIHSSQESVCRWIHILIVRTSRRIHQTVPILHVSHWMPLTYILQAMSHCPRTDGDRILLHTVCDAYNCSRAFCFDILVRF